MIKKLTILIILITVTACAGVAVSPVDMAKQDFGSYPENYKDVIEIYYSNTLRDPFSAKYRYLSEPFKAYSRKSTGQVNVFGYVVYVELNAKNGFGAYTGWKREHLFIRNDQVIESFLRDNIYFHEPWYQ